MKFIPFFVWFITIVVGCKGTEFTGNSKKIAAKVKNEKSLDQQRDFDYEEITKQEIEEGNYQPVIDDNGKEVKIDDGRPLFINEKGDYAVEIETEITEEEMDNKCKSQAVEETQALTFPNPGSCAYGTNQNLGHDAAPTAARNEQIQSIKIPKGAKLCSIQIEANTNVKYDDSLSIVFEDYFLATNGFSPTTLKKYDMNAENGHFKYDWLKMRGKSYDKDQTFCMNDTECQIPKSENNGPFTLKVEREWFKRIEKIKIYEMSQFDIKVIVTGNKQSSDCKHSGLKFDTLVKYVK